MAEFDPFKDGGAVEVLEKPKSADPEAFDPFADGQGQAHVPEAKTPEVDSSPKIGGRFDALYAGTLETLNTRLMPEEKAAFTRLDAVSDNAMDARAQAINQAYYSTKLDGVNHATLERNWPAIRQTIAKEMYGVDDPGMTDTKLFSLTAKKQKEDSETSVDQGQLKAWTWQHQMGSDLFQTKKAITGFWESINKPLAALPEAPKDLPDIPQFGLSNPALVGGVYNALRPLLEGAESPLGVATMAAAGPLKAASATYPLAAKALVGMEAVFTGLMGYGAVKAGIKAPAVLKDPNATFEDKVTAVASPVAQSGAALLGTLGMALELFPKEKGAAVVKEMEGKTPTQAAQVLRREAVETDVPRHADFLMDAARELDNIASQKAKDAVKESASGSPSNPDDSATPRGTIDEAVQQVPGEPGEVGAKVVPDVPREGQQGASAAAGTAPEEAPEAGAVKSKEPAPAPDAIGIKNDAMNAELARMGKPEPTKEEAMTFKAVHADVAARFKADPTIGEALVEDLRANPRAPTPEEDVLLGFEANRQARAVEKAEDDLLEAESANNGVAAADARMRKARAQDAFQRVAEIADSVGTKSGQSLAFRKVMLARDYSLAGMTRRLTVANKGRELPPVVVEQIRELNRRLTGAQRMIENYREAKRLQAAEPLKEAPRRGKPPGKVLKFISDRAEEARARVKARMAEGRLMSGLDPADLADHAIIGADYLAKGVTKFKDWSVAMVNELGEAIRPHLQDIFREAIEARSQAQRLQAYKTRREGQISEAQVSRMAGTEKASRTALKLDPEAERLNLEYERIKREADRAEMELEEQNRTTSRKVQDAISGYARASVLSYPTVFIKLAAAAATRWISTPAEQAIGYGISKAFPKLADKAAMEGVPTIAGAVRAESKAITQGLTQGMKGAWDMLRNKDTAEQVLFDKAHLPHGVLEYFGQMHGAMKYPTVINDFARRLQLGIENAARHGADVHDPLVQMRLMNDAWKYAKRATFQQDNVFVKRYQQQLAALEAKSKTTGRPSILSEAAATFLKTKLPVVKVPMNVLAESFEYLTGAVQGPARVAAVYARGIEKIKPEEADLVMRLMKKGFLGGAFALLGFFGAKHIGGFYQPGERRKPGDVLEGTAKINGVEVPRQAFDSPVFQALQWGATVRRASDSYFRKSDAQKKGLTAGMVAASMGLLDNVPFAREELDAAKNITDLQKGDYPEFFADKFNWIEPGALQWLAAQMDKKTPFSPTEYSTPRKTTGLKENLEKGIPVLRETLPKRKPATTYR
jgi:hypothetical protein